MNFWENNIRRLEVDYPDLPKRLETASDGQIEVFPSRQGDPTGKVGAVRLHSSYGPVSEADQQAVKALADSSQDSVLVICGLGLGYLVEAIRERFQGVVVVVEPSMAIVKSALENRTQDALPGLTLIFGETVEKALNSIESICGGASGWKRVKLIAHPPSLKLNHDYFRELNRLVNARRNLGVGGLGILIATPMYGGSLPVARYCASAFQRLGHRVEVLDNSIYNDARIQIDGITSNRKHVEQLGGLLNTLMAESITARALDRAVDLVFLVEQSPISMPVIDELHNHHIPLAFWFVEDWRLYTYWREIAPLYDYFFTIQKGEFFDHLNSINVKQAHYLPMAADPTVHRPLNLFPQEIEEFGSSVSHVGAGYPNRRQVFSGLTDLDFKLWGTEWDATSSIGLILQRDGARLSTEDSVKVFNATKVNLNLHSSPFHDGVNPDGDFLNPRTFEIASCGAFQLVDQRQLLPEHFDEGSEIAVFKQANELRGMIEHYLENPEERRKIAQRARQRVLRDHTYDSRMSEALNFIYSHEKTLASRCHPDHIDNLLAEAEGDADLAQLLGRFRDKGIVTLDDIIQDIQHREGELSRSESIFLLMNEFRKWAREKELA